MKLATKMLIIAICVMSLFVGTTEALGINWPSAKTLKKLRPSQNMGAIQCCMDVSSQHQSTDRSQVGSSPPKNPSQNTATNLPEGP